MAEVFRAELEGAEGVTRELVVKRIHHRLAMDPDAVAMFIDEAHIAARLRHPNVVQVYEFGRAGEDHFLAMELVEGCDLATLMRAWGATPAPMGLVAWVMGELLEALSYVHGLRDEAGAPLGLVHRDVSPHNILVGVAGEVKLADFGIAKIASRMEDGGEARVKGKLAFMAPEQARGETPDARADLFGAGATLYELLCGHRPYREREDAPLVEVVRAADLVPIRERAPWLSDELCAVVARAIAPRREDRFADAQSFRDALRDAFAEDAVVADRAMLQSAVRAAVATERDVSLPRADRTVTAEDRPATSPEPVAPEPVASVAPRPEPSPLSRGRRVAERVAIAAAVFVVALLAERRTRPPPPPVAPPPARPVTVSLPRTIALRAADLLRPIGRTCGVELQVHVTGVADLALGPWRAVAPTLNLLAPIEDGDADGAARALGLSLRAAGDAPDTTRFAPVGLDPVVFFARRAATGALEALPPSALDAPRAALVEVFGRAPRALRVPADDLDGWGAWDVLMASIALHRNAFAASRVWVAAGDTATASLTWTARSVTHDPDAARELGGASGVAAVLGWDRALHALDLLVIGAEITDDDALPPDDPSVAFGWAPLSRLRAADRAVWRIARPPRGDDWQLDARGESTRLGAHLVPAELYGWSVTAGSSPREAVRCAIGELTRPAAKARLRDALGWTGWSAAPSWVSGALDPALQDALEGGHLAVLRDGEGFAGLGAAWWTLWRDAVLGAGRIDPRDAAEARGRWSLRARAMMRGATTPPRR